MTSTDRKADPSARRSSARALGADRSVGGSDVVCLPIPAGGFVEGEPIPRPVAGGGGQRDRVRAFAEGEGGERVMSPGCYLEVVVMVGQVGGGS